VTVTRRRVVAAGAAWAVPAVVVGAPVPASAASPEPCELVVLPGSYKCCANGPDKEMALVLRLGSAGSCGGLEAICIADVYLSNGQNITSKVVDDRDLADGPVCIVPGQTFLVDLRGVQSCAADLVFQDIDGNTRILKRTNVPGGDENDCVTRAGG